MSIDLKYNVRIHQPVETVFGLVADLPQMKRWAAKEVRNVSPGPVGVGAGFQLLTEFMGMDQTVDYKVSRYEPCEKFAYRSSGATANEVIMTFTPFDDGPEEKGTLLTFELSVKVSGLFSPMVKGGIKKQVEGNLTRLVEVLEGED